MHLYIYSIHFIKLTKNQPWLLFAYVLVKEQRDYENRFNIIFMVESQGRKPSTWKILAPDFWILWSCARVSREFVFIRSRSRVLTFDFLFPVLFHFFFSFGVSARMAENYFHMIREARTSSQEYTWLKTLEATNWSKCLRSLPRRLS